MASATQLIRRDHKKVESLFGKFDKAKSTRAKKKICEQVIQELEVHAKLEEEIFYPAVRKHVGEEKMLQEAKQEHQEAKQIIARLKNADAEVDGFDGTFAELVESVQHHVEEEEGEMLPKAEESDMDLQECGEEMAERKSELLKQYAPARGASRSRGSAKGKSTKGRASKKKVGGRKSKSAGRRRSGRAA